MTGNIVDNFPAADFNRADSEGRTSLWLLAKNNQKEILEKVIKGNKGPHNFNAAPIAGNNKDESVFYLAAKNNWWDLVKLMLDSPDLQVLKKNGLGKDSASWYLAQAQQWDLLEK